MPQNLPDNIASPKAKPSGADSSVGLTLTYSIDAEDRICAVNDAWRGFALANEGGADLADRVVGTQLWSLVSTDSVSAIYRQLVARARKGQLVQFYYRCDAPTLRRTFKMRMEAGPRGAVQFMSELISVETRPVVSLLERSSERNAQYVCVCAWCQRVEVSPGEWVAVEEAVNRLGLLNSLRLPALTHGMCATCGIKFSVQPERGFGSPINLTLPGKLVPANLAAEPPPPPARKLEGEVCILLADDDKMMRSTTTEMLELEGFKVVTAGDGREAVDLYRQNPSRFQLVLIDLIMPCLNGDKAVEQMRQINPEVRVAVIGGFPSSEIGHRFAGAKPNEYLLKPFSPSKLLDVIQSALAPN